MQGEGKEIGIPTVFVRLSGCNLNCDFCFGVKEGYHIPRIFSIDRNKQINIDQIKQGEKILTYDSEQKLAETTVDKILTRTVNEYYKIVTNNKQRKYVTGEHPFFTTRGLVKCKNLKKGDKVIGVHWETVVKFMTQKEWDEMTFDSITKDEWKTFDIHYDFYNSLLSETHRGKNNINYKGEYEYRNFVQLKYILWTHRYSKCKCCSKHKILEAHHIDNNTENDSRDNFTLLCKSCHTKIHRKGYNFWTNRTDQKDIQLKEVFIEITNIEKIKNDDLKVYNFSCSPHNSYIIDRMWVHNCDTKYHTEGNQMSFDELEEQIKSFHIPHVTFTGGEPALQNDDLTKFIGTRLNGYYTSVETNGTIIVAPVFDNITISPKKQKINNEALKYYAELPNTTFKFVYENEDDKWWEGVVDMNNLPKDRVYIMPEGATREEQIKKMPEVIEYCVEANVKFSPRIHVLAFGNKRGV